MNEPPRPMTLEELEAAPDAAMIFLEYRLPMEFHRDALSRADSIRAMKCPAYRAAYYGRRFRCWTAKPSPEQAKATEWRATDERYQDGAFPAVVAI